jgi:hypothetical protein
MIPLLFVLIQTSEPEEEEEEAGVVEACRNFAFDSVTQLV